jgi:hypothetical protein
MIPGTRWLLLLLVAWLCSACVATRVSSVSVSHSGATVSALLIVYRAPAPNTSTRYNSADALGRRNLNELVPHLHARLPVVFTDRGVRARMVSDRELTGTRLLPGEKIMWVSASYATYSSRSGQGLVMQAEIVEPATRESLWKGEIRMGTLGFGQFDDSVADSIGVQIHEQLQKARLVGEDWTRAEAAPAAPAAPPAPPVAAAPAPAAPAPTAPAPAPRRHARAVPPASGFAEIGDVDAVPIRTEGKPRYQHYLTLPSPKAFVVYERGGWRFFSGSANAMTDALDRCARESTPCWLYAVDNTVVWQPDPARRIGRSDQLLSAPTP